MKKLKYRDFSILVLYIILTAIGLEVYLIAGIKFVYKEPLSGYMDILRTLPIVGGPSLGYCIYKVTKNRKKIQVDLRYRTYIIFRTTVESFIMFIILWGMVKLLGLK